MKVLYWDFFGPRAKGTADHFCIHLKEFFEQNKLEFDSLGNEYISASHSAAWCKVSDEVYPAASKALKPKRWNEEPPQATL